MRTIEALCGNCEHRWDVLEHGIDACPECGSDKVIKPKELTAAGFGPGATPHVVLRVTPVFVGELPAGQAQAVLARPTLNPSLLAGALWVLVCAVGVAAALTSGLPLAQVPLKTLLLILGALTAAKAIVTASLAGPIGEELGRLRIPLTPAHVVGHGVFEALIVAGLAVLLAIWWPAAATFLLLVGSAHAAIAVVGMLAGAVLRMPSTPIMVALYAALVGAAGYHGFQWLLQ